MSSITIKTPCKLKGITQKRKNRIENHGELWYISKEGPNVFFRSVKDEYLVNVPNSDGVEIMGANLE